MKYNNKLPCEKCSDILLMLNTVDLYLKMSISKSKCIRWAQEQGVFEYIAQIHSTKCKEKGKYIIDNYNITYDSIFPEINV